MSSNEPPVITDSGSSTKLLAGVVLLVTFIAGAVIGVVADRALFMARSHQPRGAQFMINRLDHQLDLSAQQRAQVTEIVQRRQARIASITSAFRPQVRQEIDAANAEIERILTPEQRRKFEKMKLHLPPRRGPGGMRRGGD